MTALERAGRRARGRAAEVLDEDRATRPREPLHLEPERERFREVVLDFHRVSGIGQGFADEVFRVWARTHPRVRLRPVKMNPAVEMMVERARSAAGGPG